MAAISVARIFNLPYRGLATRRTAGVKNASCSLSRLADCKSAAQQSATLRYDHRTRRKPDSWHDPPWKFTCEPEPWFSDFAGGDVKTPKTNDEILNPIDWRIPKIPMANARGIGDFAFGILS